MKKNNLVKNVRIREMAFKLSNICKKFALKIWEIFIEEKNNGYLPKYKIIANSSEEFIKQVSNDECKFLFLEKELVPQIVFHTSNLSMDEEEPGIQLDDLVKFCKENELWININSYWGRRSR